MPPAPRRTQAAIALIIVLISIFVLTMLAGGFAYSMKVETRLAQNSNSEAELEWMGRSGVEYCCWILAEQMKISQENYDGLNQVWAGGQGGIGTSNSPLVDVQKEVTLGNGKFTWKITDLASKWNINAANEVILGQALDLIGLDAGAQRPIVDSLLDWMDRDDQTRGQGAENDYYHSLSPPYDCKNGPLDEMSELLLVKGITPDILWGGYSTNHPEAAFQAQLNAQRGAPLEMGLGLMSFFNTLSLTPSRKMLNINTASPEALQLIPNVTPQIAEAIVAGREGEDDGSGLTGPYRNINDLQRVPELPRGGPIYNIIAQYCDTRSAAYQIEITAEIGGYQRVFDAVALRNSPKDMKILNFYWK